MAHSPLGFVPVVGVAFLLFAVIGIGITIFWIIEIVDAASRTFADPNMKIVWLLVIVLLGLPGAIVYHFVGKSQGYLPGKLPPTNYQ